MRNIDVDIVIPVYDGYDELISLFRSFRTQKNISIKNIIIPLTIGDNIDQVIKTKKFMKNKNIISFDVLKKDFSHSLTREKAIFKYCKSDIVILMTQDAKLIDEYSMYNLTKDIYEKKVVYTFGRQICCEKKCIERYIREYNYPKESYIADKTRIEKYKIKAFFASDVFAAINKNIFIRLGGYDGINIPTNEDMLYMYKILMNDYKAKYCANAVVIHYHSYNMKSLYKRYYNSGIFFNIVKIFDKYSRNSSGFHLALYVFFESLKHGDFVSLFKLAPDMICRYFGYKKGIKNNGLCVNRYI